MAFAQDRGPVNVTPDRHHRLKTAVLVGGFSALVLLCAGVAGFVWFLSGLDVQPRPLTEKADAIVVLTGGASRIDDALDLLERGHGHRLLITGVHPATRVDELARLTSQSPALFACCVDIDRRALNTTGNAAETGAWVRRHGFRSLVVVTSAYHMPRTLLELGSAVPGVRLIAFPVVSDQLRAGPWWANARFARLIALEYLKYIAARVRIRLEPATSSGTVAAANSD
ncbi:YdcF family protein [Blastochloris viridis]|uniref:DUF218 domain-containing protein n=1 Tax=Blastochloris viridis TaxID=1079 RepID=A0A0H5BP49_BLAVI|nr:YdcF family protein [Blastochloris viridis]ALK07980.1 hypothetical protein BVIR_164 [Blastochloris viridis]BAR98763.1 hypothetical protein BV133_1170 [Blastochloris viridis]CUU43902.1 hypothetical protein BVIRIDIS_29300 [Blastochloris viridis]